MLVTSTFSFSHNVFGKPSFYSRVNLECVYVLGKYENIVGKGANEQLVTSIFSHSHNFFKDFFLRSLKPGMY